MARLGVQPPDERRDIGARAALDEEPAHAELQRVVDEPVEVAESVRRVVPERGHHQPCEFAHAGV